MDHGQPSDLLLGEVAKLSLLLRISRMQFNPEADDHGRSGVRNALIGIIHFISTVYGDGYELVSPLNQLLYGLKDLDDGRVIPLLEAATINHRPPDARETQRMKAIAAVAMELHVKAGLSRSDAAAQAARDLDKHGCRDEDDQRITGKQVENWRYRAREGGSGDLARQYSMILIELEKLFPKQPGQALQVLLDTIAELAPSAIPQNPAC